MFICLTAKKQTLHVVLTLPAPGSMIVCNWNEISSTSLATSNNAKQFWKILYIFSSCLMKY